MTEEIKNAAGAQEATPVAEAAKAETVKEAPATFRFVIGEKVGMTQLFDEKGNLHGVSVVKAGAKLYVSEPRIKTVTMPFAWVLAK